MTPRERAIKCAANYEERELAINEGPYDALIEDITAEIQAESNAQVERCRRPMAERMEDLVAAATRTEPNYHECLDRMTPQMMRLLHVAMGLVTEAAEFTDMLKKHIFYGKPLDEVNLVEELGDCTWYERVGCSALEIAYLEMIERNVAKLKARFPERYSDQAAINRDLKAERAILEGK